MGVAVQSAGSYGNVLFRPLRSILSVLFRYHPGWPSLVHYHPCESMSSVIRSCCMFVGVNIVVLAVVVTVVVCPNGASFGFVGVDFRLVQTVSPILGKS